MDKSLIKQMVNKRIDEDDAYAEQVTIAIMMGNDDWLADLIAQVIGVVIEAASDLWQWIKRQFS